MKKYFFILAAAAALAACAKNEVTPVLSQENTEIAYNVAPKTKADPDAFPTTNVFASWAYYLKNTETWANDRARAEKYIVNSTISYQPAPANVWKNTDNTYYWPKGGKLTFFAYSLNKNSLALNTNNLSHMDCHNEDSGYGIHGLINLDDNPNTDFLVANIAENKAGNETAHGFNGVPTLFKHRLSRIVFAVKAGGNYANTKIQLNSIKFHKLCNAATYDQFHKETVGDNYSEYMFASGSRSTQVYTETDFEVPYSTDFTKIPVANEKRYIYIPQTFAGETDDAKIASIEVNYSVITTVEGTDVTDVRPPVSINVKDYFDSWEMGKKYTINLTFKLDEILWAPAVEDWTNGTTAGIDIQ